MDQLLPACNQVWNLLFAGEINDPNRTRPAGLVNERDKKHALGATDTRGAQWLRHDDSEEILVYQLNAGPALELSQMQPASWWARIWRQSRSRAKQKWPRSWWPFSSVSIQAACPFSGKTTILTHTHTHTHIPAGHTMTIMDPECSIRIRSSSPLQLSDEVSRLIALERPPQAQVVPYFAALPLALIMTPS